MSVKVSSTEEPEKIGEETSSKEEKLLKPVAYKSKRLNAINLLAEGKLNNKEICKEVGITPQTLCKWKLKPDFVQAVIERSRQIIKAELPEIYSSLKTKCKKGSHQHMKILFDHLDKLEEMKTKVNDNTITIQWKTSETDAD